MQQRENAIIIFKKIILEYKKLYMTLNEIYVVFSESDTKINYHYN